MLDERPRGVRLDLMGLLRSSRALERALEGLQRLRQRATKEKLSQKAIVERATRILVEAKVAKYFSYVVERGFFSFWLRRDVYRQERRRDGFFVLKTNHLELAPEAIVGSYLRLQEVERAFRVVKSLPMLRPIYHWRERRVRVPIFITFLAFLLAKTLDSPNRDQRGLGGLRVVRLRLPPLRHA
jgi:transposase